MKQQALVYDLKDSKIAIVEVVRKSACAGDCASCKGCSHHEDQTIRVRAINSIGASVGDRVWVENETKEVFTSIGIAYVLPILLMIAFYFIPSGGEGLSILASFAGFVLGVAICWLYARKLNLKSETRAVITGWVQK